MNAKEQEDRCVDPQKGNLYRKFIAGEIATEQCEEPVDVAGHALKCHSCQQFTVRIWLDQYRDDIRDGTLTFDDLPLFPKHLQRAIVAEVRRIVKTSGRRQKRTSRVIG